MSSMNPRHGQAPVSERSKPAPRPVRRPRFYRYRPVPPVGFDDEGYPVEDSAVQNHPQAVLLSYFMSVLGPRYAGRGFVTVDAALLYRKGDRKAVLAPDLLVAFGTVYGGERSYRLWERPVPALVLEVLSSSTSDNDLVDKPYTYSTLGIDEYWLYDPSGELTRPVLKGHRLRHGRYVPLRPNAAGHLASSVLGLELRLLEDRGWAGLPGDRTLRFFDPATGEFLRSQDEAEAGRQEAEARRQQAETGRQQAVAGRQRAEEDLRQAQADLRRMEARAAAAEAALQAARQSGNPSAG